MFNSTKMNEKWSQKKKKKKSTILEVEEDHHHLKMVVGIGDIVAGVGQQTFSFLHPLTHWVKLRIRASRD